jgi:hypothetical protein
VHITSVFLSLFDGILLFLKIFRHFLCICINVFVWINLIVISTPQFILVITAHGLQLADMVDVLPFETLIKLAMPHNLQIKVVQEAGLFVGFFLFHFTFLLFFLFLSCCIRLLEIICHQ